jgi:hypothetical protein
MPNQAKDIFLALETSPIAPDREFYRFEVGVLIGKSFVTLRTRIHEMVAGDRPSSLQLIIGKNGNGKTLLANKVTRFLSEENTSANQQTSDQSRRFQMLYSHISALGQANSQTTREIAASLRRSQQEEPEFTYSLLATQIAKGFDEQYRPPLHWKIVKALTKAGLRLATAGMYEDFVGAFGEVEKALREGTADELKSALNHASGKIQKSLNGGHYKRKFQEYLGELNEFDPFVKTYFFPDAGLDVSEQSVHVLRTTFLAELNRAIPQVKQVVEQIAQVGKKVGSKLVVIIIDDCNQHGFIEQLLPLINDLQKMTDPRIFLIVNMVEDVADEIRRIKVDKSIPQRLFYNPPIRLTGPNEQDVEHLYERLRALYEEAFADEGKSFDNAPNLRAIAVRSWANDVANGLIEDNYRSAINSIVAFLRRGPGTQPQPQPQPPLQRPRQPRSQPQARVRRQHRRS